MAELGRNAVVDVLRPAGRLPWATRMDLRGGFLDYLTGYFAMFAVYMVATYYVCRHGRNGKTTEAALLDPQTLREQPPRTVRTPRQEIRAHRRSHSAIRLCRA